MKPSELDEIYAKACRARRIAPQPEECKAWLKVVKDCDPRDVQAALDEWDRSSERDKDGELRSKWLPKPAELLLVVQRVANRRAVEAAIPKQFVGAECPHCHKRVSSFVAVGAAWSPICPTCRAPMNEFHREAA